jgi:hypothetical protein
VLESEDHMTVWETLVEQSKEFVGGAAGTALDTYGKKLTGGSPATSTGTKTIESGKKNWWIIGGVVAGVIGLVVWLVTRKGK